MRKAVGGLSSCACFQSGRAPCGFTTTFCPTQRCGGFADDRVLLEEMARKARHPTLFSLPYFAIIMNRAATNGRGDLAYPNPMKTCKRPGCDRTLKKMAIEGYCSGCCLDIDTHHQDAQVLFSAYALLRDTVMGCYEDGYVPGPPGPLPKLNHTYPESIPAP